MAAASASILWLASAAAALPQPPLPNLPALPPLPPPPPRGLLSLPPIPPEGCQTEEAGAAFRAFDAGFADVWSNFRSSGGDALNEILSAEGKQATGLRGAGDNSQESLSGVTFHMSARPGRVRLEFSILALRLVSHFRLPE